MTAPKALSNIGNGVLVVCAVVVTALLIRREFSSPRVGPSSQRVESVSREANWRSYFHGGNILGDTAASVEVVMFSDFECPACKVLADEFRERLSANPRALRIRYKHFPLTSHRFAEQAAIASECAGRQGKFGAMHDTLFAAQRQFGLVSWTALATRAGVSDTVAFARCQADPEVTGLIQSSIAEGNRLQVRGTPTVLVSGGARFVGVPNRRIPDSLLAAPARSAQR